MPPKSEKPKSEKRPRKTTTKKVKDEEKKSLTDTADSGISETNRTNESVQPTQTRRTNMAKKTDAEGYLIDSTGNRIIVDGEPVRMRIPKTYDAEGYQIDAAGNRVTDKNGNPKKKPERNIGQEAIAKKLRKVVDDANEILGVAKSKGINFEMSYDADNAALVLGKMTLEI